MVNLFLLLIVIFFSFLYYNAKSLLPKFDYLISSVSIYHPHIICIVKTWLCSKISSTEIEIPGYQLYCKDRNRQGGGILMYVANRMLVSLFPDPGPNLEFLTLSARFSNSRMSFLPPSQLW